MLYAHAFLQALTTLSFKLYAACMITRNIFLLSFFFALTFQSTCALPLKEQLKHVGYVELCNTQHGSATFDALYASFDELIQFLQAHPTWAQKLHSAKERFVRSKDKNYYATDFFGFYDESTTQGRSQISFYYAPHFHEFICVRYSHFNQVPEITNFLNACREIQKTYAAVFYEAAVELAIENIFSSSAAAVPILFKVVKYLPAYSVTKPHYDGAALSLFLDSTDNQSLLLSPYKSVFIGDDFSSPVRKFPRLHNQNSILLIPGAHLAEFSIYPTPHVVMPRGNIRYAAVAFAMRPNYTLSKNDLSPLPNLK